MNDPVELPFGSGLDRDTGSMAVPATAQEDLRNVILTEGIAFLDKGLIETAAFLDPDDDEPMDVILAGLALKVENAGVVVALRESTGEVHVYRVTRAGTTPSHLGVWFTLNASALTPPVIQLAEVSGLLFMAHGEDALSLRATTAYYDPETSALYPLTAAWAHGTSINPAGNNNAIKYRPIGSLAVPVTVTYVNPGTPAAAFSVVVVGGAITVNLATDGGSVVTTTANAVITGIEASGPASALVAVALVTGETGAGLVAAVSSTPIVGGMRFLGVIEHLGAYLSGWGYGSEIETRDDLVRMSMPGEPTVFRLQHYFPFGQKGDPVRSCASIGKTGLIVYKSEETWVQTGTDRSNFGKEQLDPKVGIAGPRLVVVFDGGALAWTHLGPRICLGATPIDLAIPLALYASGPSDLAATSEARLGFACHFPDRNQIRFHFGNRYYGFHLVTKRWSYGELTAPPSCAFLLPGAGDAEVQPGLVGTFSILSDVIGP